MNNQREESTFHQQWPFSLGGPKMGIPVMTSITVTARRKGDPQHMLREKCNKWIG